ncbi:MAG: hypothetical protein OXF54_12150 [Caldilineaceae bacterium]|nr:hypothetical protein [Caldilineaceae bacterium]
MTIGYTTGYRPTADEIADKADSGRDISEFFTNQGTSRQPVTSIDVDFTPDLLRELDQLAAELSVNRQAAIELCLRQAMDKYLVAKCR